MSILNLLVIIGIIAAISYVFGHKKATASVKGDIRLLHSLPSHYGWLSALISLAPAMLVMLTWFLFSPQIIENLLLASLNDSVTDLTPFELSLLLRDIHNLSQGDALSRAVSVQLQQSADYYVMISDRIFWAASLLAVCLSCLFSYLAIHKISPQLKSRNYLEKFILRSLLACSIIAILTTIGIVSSLLFETIRFLDHVPLSDFIFGLKWSPQTALRSDQVGSTGAFGAIPLFAGTLLITFIALLIAVPIGLCSAIYMTEFASKKARSIFKPLLEILAGIPTVVYGFFAALVVAPFIRDSGSMIGLEVASESALAAGIVMGIMIIPLISSLSDDVISSVPQSLRDGSFGLGATKTETILHVILPSALPGIVSAFLLAASRAIGETMIVVMAAGMAANLTANPLEAVTTVTVQIVALLTGDQEFDSAKTLSAFALGLALFIVTLILNFIALRMVRKYQEQYD